MDSARFDHLTRTVSTLLTRRTLASTFSLVALGLPSLADAKKKRKRRKKKKKVKRNEFGCVDVGKFCKNSGQCCSGICQGKKGKKKCKAHDAGTCAGQGGCMSDLVDCTSTAGDPGNCVVTTGKTSYCVANGQCFDCAKDADCVPFCGAGAACIVCAECALIDLQTACASLTSGGCTFPP